MSPRIQIMALPGILAALTLCQCAGPTRVSPEEFKREYALVPVPQSVHSVEYLGQKDGAAYINHRTMALFTSGWKDRVIYTPLEDFDPVFRASLPVKGHTTLDLIRKEQAKAKAKPRRGKVDRNNIDAILNDPNRVSGQKREGRDFED